MLNFIPPPPHLPSPVKLQCTLQWYDMNGRFQMQGGKNWIFLKEMNAYRFFWDSHWLEIWPNHRVHIFLEMKQGKCVCPLSWSVHCNFTGDGKCKKRGWACTPHPHQPGPILHSSLNVRQKAAVATLCTLWAKPLLSLYGTEWRERGYKLS